MHPFDITNQLISEDSIRKNLTSIFTDAIIVDDNFLIAAISESVLKIIGFESGELEGKTLDNLSASTSIQDSLKKELSKGFSEKGIAWALKTKDFGFITCHITGFYLGLISDLSGYIILRIKRVDEINNLNKQLETSRLELDEFVYRAAHDLRGPLATIRGLVNIMKLDPYTNEMKQLIEMIDNQAIKMDDRLLGLHYLSESSAVDPTVGTLNCSALETSLRATLEENHPINNIDFQFTSSTINFNGIQDQMVTSMLNNILLYLIALPKSTHSVLSFAIKEVDHACNIEIAAKGFVGSYQLMQAVRLKAALYSNAVTYTQLIHYFAAQKVAQKINARLRVDFVNDDEQYINILVPRNHF